MLSWQVFLCFSKNYYSETETTVRKAAYKVIVYRSRPHSNAGKHLIGNSDVNSSKNGRSYQLRQAFMSITYKVVKLSKSVLERSLF